MSTGFCIADSNETQVPANDGNRLADARRHKGMREVALPGDTKSGLMRFALVAAAGALLLAACGSDASSGAAETTSTTVAISLAPAGLENAGDPTTTISDGSEVPNDYVAQIVADAAQRSNTPMADLTVELAEQVLWSDGSLGCPEPGVAYTQAMVDGFQVVVQTPSGSIDYRTSGTDFFVVCDRG